jgi:hypothetical protein
MVTGVSVGISVAVGVGEAVGVKIEGVGVEVTVAAKVAVSRKSGVCVGPDVAVGPFVGEGPTLAAAAGVQVAGTAAGSTVSNGGMVAFRATSAGGGTSTCSQATRARRTKLSNKRT